MQQPWPLPGTQRGIPPPPPHLLKAHYKNFIREKSRVKCPSFLPCNLWRHLKEFWEGKLPLSISVVGAESCQVIIAAFCYYLIGSIPDILTNRSPLWLFCSGFLGSCDSALYPHRNGVKSTTGRDNKQEKSWGHSSGELWWVLWSPQTSGVVLSNTKLSIPLPKGKMLLPGRVTRITNSPGGRLQCFPNLLVEAT